VQNILSGVTESFSDQISPKFWCQKTFKSKGKSKCF